MKNKKKSMRMTKRHWTIEEDRALKELYPNTETAEVAKFFSRPIRAVHNRAASIGLRKTHSFIRQLNTQISHRRAIAICAQNANNVPCLSL